MNKEDEQVVDNMQRYGGSFIKQLAKLCWVADVFNMNRIKREFADYWKQYKDFKPPKRDENDKVYTKRG